ncbi:hypothetical protein BSZ32_03350 [Rubritalea profundi]|uniref:Uncharacterized protein n=1 Tax=Rubritalea profundi TaxID=1658618 RepID=A0A2S7TXX9_9BACT|nr:hypothetical protein BSZ32_03350 [Rubritalea profundi]
MLLALLPAGLATAFLVHVGSYAGIADREFIFDTLSQRRTDAAEAVAQGFAGASTGRGELV